MGGLPVSELNSLELEFLKLNGFNLTVPISELQKYGDQLLKVGYMTQVKSTSFRHTRSSSLDQARDVERVCDLTQRMSLDEQQYQQSYHHQHHPHQQYQQQRYYNNSNNNNSKRQPHQVRRMTSTNSLKDNGRFNYEQPRHSRSSVNLHQVWKPSSPLPQEESKNRRLSLTSIHAPPFIPSSELQQQTQQQQQQQQQQQFQQLQHQGQIYYYPPMGIPTPPPSASPVHHQSTYYL